MAKRSKQYSFHLNLNNPDHLKIYRTLEDLNTDIHKSVSNFVIKAIIQYINGASKSSLTKSGKNEKENLEGYVTRQELAEANLLLKAEVMKEVAQLFGNAAMNTQHLVTPELMQQMMTALTSIVRHTTTSLRKRFWMADRELNRRDTLPLPLSARISKRQRHSLPLWKPPFTRHLMSLELRLFLLPVIRDLRFSMIFTILEMRKNLILTLRRLRRWELTLRMISAME